MTLISKMFGDSLLGGSIGFAFLNISISFTLNSTP